MTPKQIEVCAVECERGFNPHAGATNNAKRIAEVISRHLAAEREGRYLRIEKAAREMIGECEHHEDGETVFHRPSHGQMARLSAALAETEVQK